nr:hypothetical protein [Elstera litoralis]
MRRAARAPIGIGRPVEIDAAHIPRREFRARSVDQARHFVRVFAAIAQQHEEGPHLLGQGPTVENLMQRVLRFFAG